MRFSLLVLAFLLTQLSHAQPILQKPIIFDQTRIKLTQQYQTDHYNIHSQSIDIEPRIIVLHWTGTRTLARAFKEFNSPVSARFDLPGKLNSSAHYLVDRDGTIYQLMPNHWMARHVIGLNHYAIGIENVGGVHDKPDLTEAQVQANIFLINYLKKEYPSIQYVIGHMEYLKFKNSPLWLEKDTNYTRVKHDPGVEFMREVRKSCDCT